MSDYNRLGNLSDLPDDDDDARDDLTPGETQRLLLMDSAHVWHPYTQHMGAPLPVPIARAEGAYLYDMSGRPILDAISSWWVTTHGHSKPEIAEAIAQQARTLDHVIFSGFRIVPFWVAPEARFSTSSTDGSVMFSKL